MDRALDDLRASLASDVAGLAPPSFPRRREPSGDDGPDVHVTVNLNGGAVFLDDERRMRLLAREIKRLIIEDVRRGIGV